MEITTTSLTFYDNFSTKVNNTNFEPLDPMAFSTLFQTVVCILYNAVFLSAVIGNTLVIYVVLSSPRMRTVTNYLIVNLALGDLLLALLCVPFSYISLLLQYWPFGKILCHIVSPAQATCVFVSAYTLTALAVDRYIAILYPLRPRMTKSQAVMVIGIVWTVAVITASPIAFFTQLTIDPEFQTARCDEAGWSSESLKFSYSLTLMILQYFLPILVLIFTYTRIAFAVWGGGKESLGEAVGSTRDHRLAQAKRKTVLMTLIVVCGYTLAWLPLNLFQLYMEMSNQLQHDYIFSYIEYVFISCHWPAMAHTTFNWVVYGWMNNRFREGFRGVWIKVWKGKNVNPLRSGQSTLNTTRDKVQMENSKNFTACDGVRV